MQSYYDKGEFIWIAPGAVRYDMEQVIFLLPWLEHLREGSYPPEPVGGYVGGSRSGIKHRASYEAVCQVAAEIDERLRRVGMDRFLVEQAYCHLPETGINDWDKVIEMLAVMVFMPTWEVRRRIRSAVSYIASGPCPRWLNCLDCPSYASCRRKKRVGMTYGEWKRSRSHNIISKRR